MIVLIFIISGRIEKNILESTWAEKREDIANGISKLDAASRKLQSDIAVRLGPQPRAEKRWWWCGESAQQVDTGRKEGLVIADDE